jgi:hypothetical protein
MSADLKRLRDAAGVMRAAPCTDASAELRAVFAAIGDWLQDTARRAQYTDRGIDLVHACHVADVILGGTLRDGPR